MYVIVKQADFSGIFIYAKITNANHGLERCSHEVVKYQ